MFYFGGAAECLNWLCLWGTHFCGSWGKPEFQPQYMTLLPPPGPGNMVPIIAAILDFNLRMGTGGSVVKNPMQETQVQSLGWENWRRKWQFTPIFSPGESHGQRSLAGYSP